nr:GNAT family N-acetyltransferase [uncultured Pedobacter sp.]
MIKVTAEAKQKVVNILTKAFEENSSVNYIVKQDKHRVKRIRALMDYSFEMCSKYGEVYLSEDENACALVLFPELKKDNFWTIGKDLKLIAKSIGFSNILKALKRESLIKQAQLKDNIYYLWFIGVDPGNQNRGLGSELLNGLVNKAKQMGRTVCLETSTERNIPWYQKNGFEIYNKIDLGYELFFLKN